LLAAGAFASRDDVIQALDMACEYYKRFEPSSPVPLLLQRAKRLASKDFLSIIRDMVPESMPQIASIGGINDGDENAGPKAAE
jgi:type VI secretion system protein ImpA